MLGQGYPKAMPDYECNLVIVHTPGLQALSDFTTIKSLMAERAPADWGFGLPGMYLAWFLIVLALYFPCRWFARVKRERRDPWLSYL